MQEKNIIKHEHNKTESIIYNNQTNKKQPKVNLFRNKNTHKEASPSV